MLTIIVEIKTASLEGTEWFEEYVGTDKREALSYIRNLRLMDEVIDIRYGFYQELAGAQLVWTDKLANGDKHPCQVIHLTDDDLPF